MRTNVLRHLACALLFSLSIGGAAHASSGTDMKTQSKTNALSLRGRVVKVDIARENKHSIVFDVQLQLEFINTSEKPVIIWQHNFWLGAKTLARSPEDAAAHKYLYSVGHWPSVSSTPEGEELRQRLNQPNPPPDLTRVLAPGEVLSYETTATLYIEKAGSSDKRSQSWDAIRQASPMWLQVVLETWASDIEPGTDPNNPEFGKMLQRRWQQFGELQLSRVKSEPMPLSFETLAIR